MKRFRIIVLMALFAVASLFVPAMLWAQDKPGSTFDTQEFILTLMANGGLGMLVSGWIAAKWTNASGIAMVIQTLVVAIVLTAGASLLGIIPVPISDYWQFLLKSVTNGVLSMILYKLGIFDSVLGLLKAKSVHQLSQLN